MNQSVEKKSIYLKVSKRTFTSKTSKDKKYVAHTVYLPASIYALLDLPDAFEIVNLDIREKTLTLKAIKGGETRD